jgi:hypothetical protein
MVVRILAKPAEIPARKVTWLASPATDGKTGHIVQVSDFGRMLSSVSRVLMAKLFKSKLRPIDIQMESIPGAQKGRFS